MRLRRTLGSVMVAVVAVLLLAPSAAHARSRDADPVVSELTTFGSGLGSGSTIGPGRDLFVTDGNSGGVWRIDPDTGDTTLYADGLPLRALGIGGAMDVAFIGRTMYVLVTLVGGELDVPGGPFPIGDDDPVGIYRLERDGSWTVVADIGAWSLDNPPSGFPFFIDTGVQYAIQAVRGGFLVTDGHHNRVLRVTKRGEISEHLALGNIVPTGLDVAGKTIYSGQLGPIPHLPEDGKAVAFGFRNPTVTEVASGAAMIVDVEMGQGRRLFALSQGEWDGEDEGSPALPDTGRLVEVHSDGTMTPVVDGDGEEIVLDRPTSLEFIGDTAYVISLSGAVTRIDDVTDGKGRHHGRHHPRHCCRPVIR